MKSFLSALVVMLLSLNLLAADALLPQRVLYVGGRESEFGPFLKKYFTTVECIPLPAESLAPSRVKDFDVVLLDWPQDHQRSDDGQYSPLGKREGWNKPTVLLGSAGLNLAIVWKLKGGSGCTCLAPVAYNLRDHPIFKGPFPIDILATTNIPTPPQFSSELKTSSIPVVPLVNGIREYHSVIDDYARGWSTHYFEFADMPDVEVFSGGINEQTSRSAAFWRQGNLLHFGFEQSPTQMNDVGGAMLINAIVYISHFNEDRPIDVTLSVFGKERVATSRNRAKSYFEKYRTEVPEIFSPATLADFNWHDPVIASAWFATNRPWISPNTTNLLEVDAGAKSLGVPFDAPEFLPKTIAALRDEKSHDLAAGLLARYIFNPLGAKATAEDWDKWWRDNSPYVFYSELGGYRWYIDPLAKKRGFPTKELRGPARADLAIAKYK